MDSDYSTAFAQRFQDAVTVLRHDADYTKSADLSMSFHPERGLLTLSAWDGRESERNSHLETSDPKAVADFIRDLEIRYETRVESRFRTLPEQYIYQLRDSLGFSGQLRAPSDCETCGLNDDELEAFYYPAFELGVQASLAVYNRYGCYGGASVYGDPRESSVRSEALRILRSGLETSEGQRTRAELSDFIGRLKAVLETISVD